MTKQIEMNFINLDPEEISNIKNAINQNEDFYGYIPEKGMQFILENYLTLAEIGHLERNWMQAYVFASDFNHIPLEMLQKIFDICDRKKLQELYPIPPANNGSITECWSLFRGCAGSDHRMGMSWTSSLSKALWYAAWHKEYKNLHNCCVYATIVEQSEIYCYLERNEPEFIVSPKSWWKIEIPQSEFRIDRPR